MVYVTRWQRSKRHHATGEKFVIFNIVTVLLEAQFSHICIGKQMRQDLRKWLSPQIPRLITTLRAKLTTREPLVGSSKAVSSNCGRYVLCSCGYYYWYPG